MQLYTVPSTRRVPDEDLEEYSSAYTLSDMEIFVFPELLFSLVLANIMSPRIWRWRDDPWFSDIERLTPTRRVLRLKQFIMDHYEFNLDLETWGLTTKERELQRFERYLDPQTIAQSNALFGYEGDKYYFDIDIRRHFGLDKYDSNVIPYWKTETVEAMDAFRFKPGRSIGAGECVSLAALYAAALFIVCRIPLEQIFLMGTPLHSQNFIDVGEGILTNNRRVLTKAMWFNGTETSGKAQRALRHEQVTVVAHVSGYVHSVYRQATIQREAYEQFARKLRSYLHTDITMSILANYLRQNRHLQTCFQIAHSYGGKMRYIPAEIVYHYEHSSRCRVSDHTLERLLQEIDEDEYYPNPIEGRIPLNKFQELLDKQPLDLNKEEHRRALARELTCYNAKAEAIVEDIWRFTHLEPRLPKAEEKEFVPAHRLRIAPKMTREEILEYLSAHRSVNRVADLAFYAHRDMTSTDWRPFLKAAIERNPVCLEATSTWDLSKLAEHFRQIPDESIYEGPRLAQPDEVWNYQRGDGLEKAICLANILKSRKPHAPVHIVAGEHVRLTHESLQAEWPNGKKLVCDFVL